MQALSKILCAEKGRFGTRSSFLIGNVGALLAAFVESSCRQSQRPCRYSLLLRSVSYAYIAYGLPQLRRIRLNP